MDLGLELYGVRFGSDLHNSKLLLEEINEVGMDNIEVICLSALETSIMLSYKIKEKFVKELAYRSDDTSVIAAGLIDFDDCSYEPILEEEG